MGSTISRRNETATVQTHKSSVDLNCSLDPRSPTPEITRTPIQQDNVGCKHNITKNADLRKNFENGKGDDKPILLGNPILSAVIKNHLLSYDPRSPTQDFKRTPIIIASKYEEIKNKSILINPKKESNNDSLCEGDNESNNCDHSSERSNSPGIVVPKNLCNEFFDMTLNDSINETEKPLGESTASNEAIIQNETINSENSKILQQDNKSTLPVLETNFDYLEEEKNDEKQTTENKTNIENQVDIQNEVLSVRSDSDFASSGTDLDISNIPLYRILEADPRSPTIGIERTPIIVAKDKIDSSDNNVEEMSDDSLIKVLQEKNAELRESVHNSDNSTELLIYEDQCAGQDDTPKTFKTASNSNSNSSVSRTPLLCMKNKGEPSQIKPKSVNSLSGTKDKKINKRVSHIPRLKSLSKQYMVKQCTSASSVSLKSLSKPLVTKGCENTPPHSHRERWDKDNSIVL